MRRLLLVWCITLIAVGFAAGEEASTVTEQRAGRKIYEAKCAKCHAFYEPKNYSEVAWQTWLKKMSKKSKLKEEQARLLARYLKAYREGEAIPKAEGRDPK
jgi:cytochrome c5